MSEEDRAVRKRLSDLNKQVTALDDCLKSLGEVITIEHEPIQSSYLFTEYEKVLENLTQVKTDLRKVKSVLELRRDQAIGA